MDCRKPKPLLDRTIRAEWLLGLFLSLAVYYHLDALQKAREDATSECQQGQRPDLIDRRNREMDALSRCLERQVDLALRCRD